MSKEQLHAFIDRARADENFRSRESELVVDEPSNAELEYANLPTANLDRIIIDHKELHKKNFIKK